MASAEILETAAWLVDGARSADEPEQVLDQLCAKLVGMGVPLWRVGVFVRTLHPDVFGRSFVWRLGTKVITSTARHDIVDSEQYRTSPLYRLYANGETVRCRIADGDDLESSQFLKELRDEGGTDYIAIPLVFTDGSIHATSWSTRRPGGFTDAQISELYAIIPPFARVAEIRALRRTASNLLDTYVGNQAGGRILAGQIRRGYAESIKAVIWLSDMRGFTALSDRLSPERVVDILNRYFDCQVPAILKNGGEVLKFMGDGLLAIFPTVGDSTNIAEVCSRALAAARETRASVSNLNTTQGAWSRQHVRFGLALHVGQVLYGNIGGGNRLDFTCIGPAVNLSARIEKLAGKLCRTVVASADFVRYSEAEWDHVGTFSVAGFSSPQNVFGLHDESAPEPAPAAREPAVQPA
jgi:adenylate cyclase